MHDENLLKLHKQDMAVTCHALARIIQNHKLRSRSLGGQHWRHVQELDVRNMHAKYELCTLNKSKVTDRVNKTLWTKVQSNIHTDVQTQSNKLFWTWSLAPRACKRQNINMQKIMSQLSKIMQNKRICKIKIESWKAWSSKNLLVTVFQKHIRHLWNSV